MYSTDDGGSVKPSAYVRRTHALGMFWTPEGFEVTDVDVYGGNNRAFDLREGIYNSAATLLIQQFGVMNSTMTLSTPKEFVLGKYGIIKIELASTTDTIYGAKITMQKI